MTKLAVKCGDVEFEYDGPEEFLKQELLNFVREIAKLRTAMPAELSHGGRRQSSGRGLTSVSTLAQKLKVKNGSELIIAAALSYHLSGTLSFTKKNLRDRVKEATAFYKSSYANNFDNYVARMVKKGRLSHTGGDNYALPDQEASRLEAAV